MNTAARRRLGVEERHHSRWNMAIATICVAYSGRATRGEHVEYERRTQQATRANESESELRERCCGEREPLGHCAGGKTAENSPRAG